MMKARFLGFSPDSGDDFTYVIVTDPDSDKELRRIFTRSVIRLRLVYEAAPVLVRKGKTKAPNPLLTIQEEPEPLGTIPEYERAIKEVYGPPPSKQLRTDPTSDDEDLFDLVNGHEFCKGVLFLSILWKTDETSWVTYRACREDFPYETAKYICANKIGSCSGNHKNGPHQRWA
ncbi:unnamed protein product [Cylindrotheca closterium]|uniref:Uncharacterized protein n=1 Tax=Cylindrotheca closterium TaxID=2856 RepID=A0AAD2FZ09_9STRA|nr:unnamed protein product [Cylindrotheca closterium]